MTTYLTTAEVADLKGCSLQYVQKCIKEGKIKASVRETAANNRTEYCILLTDLPEKVQIKWENKKQSELGLEPVPLSCKNALKPDPRQITLQDLTGDQRDNVGFWCDILQEWQRVRSSRGENLGKCKVDELYCATVKLKYPNINISPDILYRRYKAYKRLCKAVRAQHNKIQSARETRHGGRYDLRKASQDNMFRRIRRPARSG